MSDVCFSPAALALLVAIGGVLQTVVVTLFWLFIRSQQDATRDARQLRDQAIRINEQMIQPLERQVEIVERAIPQRALPPRGKRS